MSHIRRWARAYYNLSPIFQDDLFQKPGNEALVAINPRLFSAYLIKMTKKKVYTKEKIGELMHNYYSKPNYWTSYTLKLLSASQQAVNSLAQQKYITRQRFQALISKFYYKKITQDQFKELCQCLQDLLPTKKISQLDFYVMDLSFSSIQQIIQVSSISQQSALEAIGHNSFELLEKQLKHNINHNIFQLIVLFNKLKQSGNLTPELSNLQSMYEGNKKIHELFQNTKKQLGICMRKQALGFMLWLLHVNQLGDFVFKFIKQDYLFSRYCENSVQITCNILQVIEVSSSQKFSELILLNQIVHKLQNMQQQKKFFEHVKRNIQIQIKLKNFKQKLQQYLHRFEQTGMQVHKWIEQIDKFQIDFKSSHSVTIISNLIKKLLQNQYFSIILPDDYYGKLLRLCIKFNDKTLYSKILSKIDKKKHLSIYLNKGLLYYLQKTRSDTANDQSIKVYSIYELKRIKNICQRNGDKIKEMIREMRSQDQDIILIFLESLKKHSKDDSGDQIKQKIEKIFEEFKL